MNKEDARQMNEIYKPWGNIDWIMSKLDKIDQWNFLGSISAEERSLGAWNWLMDNKKIKNYEMWLINDPKNPPSPYRDIFNEECEQRIQQYEDKGGQGYCEFELLESDTNASACFNSFIKQADGNVIIDISTMPKRWFFPIIRDCLTDNCIKNLLVMYTIPKHYSKKQGEDPMPWKYFPSFGELPEREQLEKIFIISAGYQPLSLPMWISNYESSKIYILFPFPASISGYPRAWDFIRTIESDRDTIENSRIVYVPGYNLPEIYSTICKIMDQEEGKEPIFSPYGPKPVSLAIAMIASQSSCPVGYTQPAYYNPYYSTGIETVGNNIPKTMSYLLKVNGRNLYAHPSFSF